MARKRIGKEDRQRADELLAKAEELSTRILPVTVPLLELQSDGSFGLLGSGVLIAIAGIRFLVTAGHVQDFMHNSQLTVGLSPELIPLVGKWKRLRSIIADSDDDDKIDIGIVRLDDHGWESVALDRFLAWSELDHDSPRIARHTYGLVGYPENYNDYTRQVGRLKARAIRFAGLECERGAYDDTGIDSRTNVMVEINRKEMWNTGGQYTLADLHCTSGSGIWRYGRRIRGATESPKLAAIMIESHQTSQHKHILGTRIHVVVEALYDWSEDVQRFIDLGEGDA